MNTPERRDWSLLEVEATVSDYLDMLLLELEGIPYTKADHWRALQSVLDNRSKSAIERKYMNISAALIDLGIPSCIDGYKPYFNYQKLVREVVRAQLPGRPTLLALLQQEVTEAPVVPSVDDILKAWVAPPERQHRGEAGRVHERQRQPYGPQTRNYIELEARNAQLGRAGEEFVINFERARLLHERQDRLAARVEHVAITRGDHEGFDVLSFTAGGRERFIEVKTTKFGAYTPFYVTRNEVQVSRTAIERYHVYRVFDFRRVPRLFSLAGAIDAAFDLEASQFLARLS